MTFTAWLSVAALCALGAASPGPSLAVVLRHSIGGSRLRGMVCAGAHSLGVGVYALLSALGLAAFLARHPGAYRLVAVAGAVYLAWLGVGLLRRDTTGEERVPGTDPVVSAAAARDGFVTALLNPKIAVFFVAIFSPFAGPAPGFSTVAILTVTAIAIDALWYGAVAAVCTTMATRGSLRGQAVTLERIAGLILLAAAGWLLVASWPA